MVDVTGETMKEEKSRGLRTCMGIHTGCRHMALAAGFLPFAHSNRNSGPATSDEQVAVTPEFTTTRRMKR